MSVTQPEEAEAAEAEEEEEEAAEGERGVTDPRGAVTEGAGRVLIDRRDGGPEFING